MPNKGFCNDIAIDKKGDVYVTDSFNPRILVLRKGQKNLELFLEDSMF